MIWGRLTEPPHLRPSIIRSSITQLGSPGGTSAARTRIAFTDRSAMKQAEMSLRDRAHRMYRRLLLLQNLFHPSRSDDEGALESDDWGRNLALGAAVREVLDELTEHARLLTSVPYPISEWRPGDTGDDERWHALTEVERREVLSLVAGYEALIAWTERRAGGHVELAALIETSATGLVGQRIPLAPQDAQEAAEFLKAERMRVRRFREEMRFLNGRGD